ncbi:membrane integrity-associated transporter subunit PqiC [Halomonas aquamarina]|uniref:Membrane integrity-associated transporter subunit PqiC n=1 Tax=Vreelandella aquamarina TaxID=77097 RepID=A0ACC5VXH0_9GAMM|nr:ABC-type transport auxiliary lipoprotein family protein [Halomonas aquamarina]MBZ5488214.1 membrane integrity-associated transporter subunit PqiC [Halomonas aquamarina]
MRLLPLKLVTLLGFCLALSACASSVTPPARYMLPDSQLVNTPSNPQGTLQVRAPRIAHYLDVDGIIMQLDDITLNEAREHQWAESLGRQLSRRLRSQLSRELPTIRVVREDGGQPQALTLRLDIDQFQGRHDGMAVASGQWQLRSADDELLALESFSAQTALDSDGYPALVRALSASWDKVALQIAEQVRQGNYFTARP